MFIYFDDFNGKLINRYLQVCSGGGTHVLYIPLPTMILPWRKLFRVPLRKFRPLVAKAIVFSSGIGITSLGGHLASAEIKENAETMMNLFSGNK